jgi:hypothetical protein
VISDTTILCAALVTTILCTALVILYCIDLLLALSKRYTNNAARIFMALPALIAIVLAVAAIINTVATLVKMQSYLDLPPQFR